MWFRSKTSVCVFRVQSTVLSVETSRTVTSAWIVVPAVWRRISRQCGSTATPRDTVCHATPTARCREWISHTHAHNHTVQCTHIVDAFTRSVYLFQLYCDGWARVPRWYQNRVSYFLTYFNLYLLQHWKWTNLRFFLSPFRPVTTIAAAIGGVVLVLILLALLVFYLRRQKKLKRKETLRRILQEHEVGAQGQHK